MSTTTTQTAAQLAADAADMPNRRIVEVLQSAGYTGPTSYGKRRLIDIYTEFFTNCPVTEAADWPCTCPAEDMGGEHMEGCKSAKDFGPSNPESWQHASEDAINAAIAAGEEAAATAALEFPTEPKAQAKTLGLPLKSFQFFRDLAEDAGNWGGTPLIGGNVAAGRSAGGMTRKLIDAGLIRTFDDEGDSFASFTAEGIAAAAKLGIDLSIYA